MTAKLLSLFLPAVFFLAGCATPPAAVPLPPHRAVVWTSEWTPIFNGRDLSNWTVTDFYARGAVTVQSNQIRMAPGALLTGINWTNGPLPRSGYEISLDAMKTGGSDFFCGRTFPVNDAFCSLIVGGWGGGVVGLSSLNDMDASENETTKQIYFDTGRWYHIRLRVTAAKIQAWIDDDKIIDANIAGRKISLRPGPIEFSKPLGIATYQTGAAIRDIQLRLTPP